MTIRRGDRLRIRPEWADPGDDAITYVAIDDEEKGRVTITALVEMTIRPTQVVNVETVKRIEN